MSYTVLLLETVSLPIDIMVMERVVEYMLKVQLRRIAWDIAKLFGRWDATRLLDNGSLDSSVNEAFLLRQCIITWDKCGGSASQIIVHIFLAEGGNDAH